MAALTRRLGQVIGRNQLQVVAQESREVNADGSEGGEQEDPGVRSRGVRMERSPDESHSTNLKQAWELPLTKTAEIS